MLTNNDAGNWGTSSHAYRNRFRILVRHIPQIKAYTGVKLLKNNMWLYMVTHLRQKPYRRVKVLQNF